MKKLVFGILTMLSLNVYAQNQNTFPTNGNVGINTTSPSAKLDVNGNMKVDSCLLIKDSLLVEKDMRAEGDLKVEGKSTFLGSVSMESDLKVTGHATFFDQLVLPGTSLIGTTDNANILIVNSTTNEVKTTGLTELKTGLYKWPTNYPTVGTVEQPITCSLADLNNPYWISDVAKLVPSCPDVNVGVGTLFPQSKFHVYGLSTFDGNIGLFTSPSGLSAFHIYNQNKLSGMLIENDQSQNNVPNDGWYGLKISTTNPGIKAIGIVGDNGTNDVFRVMGDGTVWATEINVDVKEDFPDYVFAEDYNLICIDSVQAYVEQEGHLPNLPSAEEVKQEGINIASFEVQQTEKIEEMYLYMFEMNERMKKLEEEMEELKQENRDLKEENIQLQEKNNNSNR